MKKYLFIAAFAYVACSLGSCKRDAKTADDSATQATEEMVAPETYADALKGGSVAADELLMSIVEMEELIKRLPAAKAQQAAPLLEELRAMDAKYQGAVQELAATVGSAFGPVGSDAVLSDSEKPAQAAPAAKVEPAFKAFETYKADIDRRVRELTEQIRALEQR